VHLDSGANVGMMDLRVTEQAGLSSQIQNGRPSFSTADGKMATALGWLDVKLGLGTRLELKTHFVIAQGLDYQVLLGTNVLRPLHGVIDYHSKRFKFQLPTSKEWRSLPLIDSAPQTQNAQAVALIFNK
jgi:predicted aspartyl protease